MDTLTGSVERITYYNPENGYSVVRLRPDRGQPVSAQALTQEGLVTLTGNLPELSPGEHLRLQGRWTNHAKHGYQYQVEVCEQTMPATVAGIRRYLGSGLIKGIGPRLAERIVKQFGMETLEVIESAPDRLQQVPDIGPKRAGLIAAAWEEQKQVKEIMLFLHSHNVSTNLAIKVYKQYGEEALEVVRTDPYRLARDIFGVGFKTADRLAQALGLPLDHPSRIEAGLIYALNEMSDEGHVYAPQGLLAQRAVELLQVGAELIPPAIERLAADDRIRPEQLPQEAVHSGEPDDSWSIQEVQAGYHLTGIYLTPYYYGETGVAERLRLLAKASALTERQSRLPMGQGTPYVPLPGDAYSQSGPRRPAPQTRPSAARLPDTAALSEEQRQAVQQALEHPLSILTGGPGTGKTFTVQALIAALEAKGKRYALASPTGRAAKRLSEATGRPASTIHRLLDYSPGEGFKFNADHPLPVDFLVIDEASMLDLLLANHLLKALRPGVHILFVGDVDQLPSVGAGDVLRDLIASEIAPVTRLGEIFRQAANSMIITNAHRINQGRLPDFPKGPAEGGSKGDFFLFPAENAEEAADWVQQVVCERIPRTFGFHPKDQIQVLAPMYRGAAGVHALNERLQKTLNPSAPLKPEKQLFGQTLRVGDKVMQIQNNYDKDVFNGDIGYIAGLDLTEQTLTVTYDGRLVAYDFSETDQLVLAYAISVHKAQGSEFPVVVVPIVTQHYMMLQRNLLYTAVTRARKLCVLVGSRRAIAMAVRNNAVAKRFTALDWRLKG